MVAFSPMTTEKGFGAAKLSVEAVYLRYREAVFRWAMRFGAGNVDWAEDLAHDVFEKVFTQLPKLENTDELAGWLYRVTANLAVSRLRREQSVFARVRRLYRAGRQERSTRTPELELEQREEAVRALSALESLPARERVAITMTVLDGRTQREVARDLGLSEGYVSKILKRAWGRLREAGWETDDD